ncbi:MAG: hypothetical protein COX31_02420 [Candidatus Moranbacteria bacterium CG23_combo_of_CG06-09_8_20_14_all_40_16]|nr:MAG: hypothetical protein COX31_02420 [Candidatus Moranbacteria bacterium CG23_combo_of_CG06-09_8_20_14_all_40_16]
MIQSVITILYGIIVLSYVLVSLFIIYHIFNYSFNSGFKFFSLLIFTLVSASLLITNLMFFWAINWSEIFSKIIT